MAICPYICILADFILKGSIVETTDYNSLNLTPEQEDQMIEAAFQDVLRACEAMLDMQL